MSASPRPKHWSARNVTAVLGPTNTGKTHLAIERMLGHESGMIGLPLRLLAREVYGRVAARAGADQVALVTGEEKILPPEPRYWISTVEAMPRETDAAFVAIDEVQIAGDLERGHVFTDRLLNLRGAQETLLLGAATMRGIVEKLLPGIHVVTRPRMSVLSYSGQKKLTRLPERSAIVAFSADEVYAVGELIRRQRGGAAVVLGALSPRTRNKQVEIYQSGDVDFLVATDAIGMGLNLDLDHVAFASNRKYDGYQHRELTAAELGQVAGRAGRHMRDGTFGVTGRVDPLPPALVEALETHRFSPIKTLQWRSDQLDFSSIEALKASLDEAPQTEGLTKALQADDQAALDALSRDDEVTDKVRRPDDVRRLWEVCRLPDYRKIAPAQHAQLVSEIFAFVADGGTVPDDWIAGQIRQANRAEGDIDTLSSRIAHIRTWTFVANQPDWLAEPATWREETKAVEDTLSDALHERLTKRFVDRRTSVLMRRLRENTMLEAEITPTGDVLVESHHVGVLQGFRFTADPKAEGAEAQALRGAAQKALTTALTDRAERLSRAADAEIVLSLDGSLRWQGEPVGRLLAGDTALKPRLVLLADEQLAGAPRDRAETRLNAWLKTHIETLLKPLADLASDETLTGVARGVAFRLVENLGIVDRRSVLEEVRGLDQEARAGLRRHGVRFGAYHIYLPALLKPGPSTLAAQLWALKHKDLDLPGLAELPGISGSGRTSVTVDTNFDPELYRRFGFRIYGNRAVRIDILERLADLIRPAISWTPGAATERPPGALAEGNGFTVTPAMTSLLGASGNDLAVILSGLGYRMERRPKPPEEADAGTAASTPSSANAADPQQTAGEAAAPQSGDSAEEERPTADQSDAAPATDQADTPAGAAITSPEATPASPAEPVAMPEGPNAPLEEPALAERCPEDAPALDGHAPQLSAPEEAQALATELPTADAAPTTAESAAPAATEATQDGADETGETEGVGDPDQPDVEPVMIEVWRAHSGRPKRAPRKPRGQGYTPRQSDGNREGQGPRRRKGKPRPPGGEGRRPGQERDGAPRNDRAKPRPPRERSVDPDSPFAALAALKKDLEKSGE